MSALEMPAAAADPHRVSAMEELLAATLHDTAHEVAHSDCFDSEQRAEVYTILETLKANSQTHRSMVKLLAAKLAGEHGDA